MVAYQEGVLPKNGLDEKEDLLLAEEDAEEIFMAQSAAQPQDQKNDLYKQMRMSAKWSAMPVWEGKKQRKIKSGIPVYIEEGQVYGAVVTLDQIQHTLAT